VKDEFDRYRPEDINIFSAISQIEGEVILYSWGKNSVYNTISEISAREHENSNKVKPEEIVVPSKRLENILDEYLPVNTDINFLNIDAEGKDLEVLKSNNWSKYRPELVVVEYIDFELENLLESEIHKFMSEINYKIRLWLPPSVIYEKQD